MKIYVVRHGQTDYNVKNIYQGQNDIPLNVVGIQQAEQTSKKFSNIKIDAILVSPLIRTRQTAEYISKMTNVPITIENGLIERSFGDMEGKTNQEDCNINMLSDYDKNYDIYNVEPVQDLFQRVYECMDKIIKEFQNKDIVLVTHGCVSQAIECYFHGMPEDKNILALTLKNCEVREYSINK